MDVKFHDQVCLVAEEKGLKIFFMVVGSGGATSRLFHLFSFPSSFLNSSAGPTKDRARYFFISQL